MAAFDYSLLFAVTASVVFVSCVTCEDVSYVTAQVSNVTAQVSNVTAQVSNVTADYSTTTSSDSKECRFSGPAFGAIIGISFGAALGLFIIVIIICWLYLGPYMALLYLSCVCWSCGELMMVPSNEPDDSEAPCGLPTAKETAKEFCCWLCTCIISWILLIVILSAVTFSGAGLHDLCVRYI